MKGECVLVCACCPSELIDNGHFHFQGWPGLDNVLCGYVSKGFILQLLLFSGVGGSKRT